MSVPSTPHPSAIAAIRPAATLSGSVHVDERSAIVTVIGDIDILSVPRLTALLSDAIDSGATRVVADLAGVTFMDARGLAAFEAAARRLASTGGRLALRDVPEPVFRIFELSQLTKTLDVARSSAGSTFPGGLGRMSTTPELRDVVDAALGLVVTLTKTVVAGAAGASITVRRNGALCTVAASNDVVLQMDHDQYDTGEGPCLDAAVKRIRCHSPALVDERRWPAFVPRARGRGIRAILSTPFTHDDRALGALNIYSTTTDPFDARDIEWADMFAAAAANVLASGDQNASAQARAGEIRRALVSREAIARAEGIVMQRDGVTAAAAHLSLRELSRQTGQPLQAVCAQLAGGHGE